MLLRVKPIQLAKQFALRIARGTSTHNTNLWVAIAENGIEGWGEASPFNLGDGLQTSEKLAASLQELVPVLADYTPWQRQAIEQTLRDRGIPSAVRAAIDIALHDWMGKYLQIPLWQLWGLDRSQIVPISVTIGIGTPESGRERLAHWLTATEVNLVKVKLGNPDGIDADRALLSAVQAAAPSGTRFLVDANGGWSLADAIAMSQWLGDRGVEYVEQPLPKGQEADLPALKSHCPLPIFLDESCWTSRDVFRFADRADGINIKLMKAGGLSEAQRAIAAARAVGWQVMLGCYSDSTLLNTAAAHLSPLADYLDLDSHLNLVNCPFRGATLDAGRLLPNERPGLGVILC